jgi:hypothetical protein
VVAVAGAASKPRLADDCEAALPADPHGRRRIEELKAELIHRGFDLPMLVDLARRLWPGNQLEVWVAARCYLLTEQRHAFAQVDGLRRSRSVLGCW